MKTKKILMGLFIFVVSASVAEARTKLVALPERDATIIRLDNPAATLIEEERVLTLQKGLNKVDFSWSAVSIDPDSIRLTVLDHPEGVTLLNVSYPPGDPALVWEISSDGDYAETVRISYLLSNIDRLVTYKAIADKGETQVDLKSYLVLRNFSGEDFDKARVLLDYGESFEQGIAHEETKQMLFLKAPAVPITKIWTWDSAARPWDPEKLENQNIGIPVSYRIFQDDGSEGTIFLGEDYTALVPVGQKTELYIGDSRDIVVTQRKQKDERINLRKNNKQRVVLFDTDETVTAKIENFKDKPATLTMVQRIPGQWKMKKCILDGKKSKYVQKDAHTLEFEIELPARNDDGPGVKELSMRYSRIHVRP
ncbi:MAG: hypothetical protein ACYSPI_02245 [Planctomycetota bacterium]|jgi:hypothetical protein